MRLYPTILTDDKDDYEMQLRRDANFAEVIDIDVIDWSLTPNKTVSAIDALDNDVNIRLNFDLMMDEPSKAIEVLVDDHRVGKIIVNLALQEDFGEISKLITEGGKILAVSFHEDSQYAQVKELINEVRAVHVFAIKPGAQGNKFRPEMLEYANRLRNDGFKGEISLDGGVNAETLPLIMKYPFDTAVAGSAISKSSNPEMTYRELLDIIEEHSN